MTASRIGLSAIVLVALIAAATAAEQPARKVVTICGNEMKLMTADEVRALGFPWTDVADDKNAATYYIQGANLLHALKEPDNWVEQYEVAVKSGWDEKLTVLAAYVKVVKPALDAYRKGAAQEKCQLPYNKSPMLAGMLLPTLSKARQAGRLLVADARRLEAKGKHGAALDSYLAVSRIGVHHGSGRTLIDQLVGVACIGLSVDGAFRGVIREKYSKKQLERLLKELDALRPRLPEFAHAMKSERAFGLGTMDDIMRIGPGAMAAAQGGIGGMPGRASPLAVRLFRILFPDQTIRADMARFYDRSIAAAKTPYHKAESRQDPMKQTKPWNVFAAMLLPALSRARASAEGCKARFDSLRLAVALQLYRKKEGAYPERLDWLRQEKVMAELPVDPFSGKPYRYKLGQGEFVVYSVGENFKDDGGQVGRDAGNKFPDIGLSSKQARAGQ